MWWITNQKCGVNAVGLQRLLGLGSYKTAWTCLHKLRRAMVRTDREQLSGRVEVDETVIGGERRGAHGWHADKKKALVVVAAEIRGEGIGRIRLRRVPDTKFSSLNEFVSEEVVPGSEIITDGHRGYLEISGLGYSHSPTVLKKDREKSGAVLGRAHRVAALLKRWLLGMHQGRVSIEQLEHYLEEFTFRFNRRRSTDRGMLFYRLAQQSIATGPQPYRSLIK
jgi:transposase-like protein